MKQTIRYPFLVLVAVAATLRGFLMFTNDPVLFPDSYEYLQAARNFQHGEWLEDNGKRLPVYPLIIAVVQNNLSALIVFQCLCGIGITILLYRIMLVISESKTIAFWSAIAYSLHIGQLFFEFNILSETLATLLTLLLVNQWIEIGRGEKVGSRYTIQLAMISAGLVLVKPMFFFIPLIVFFSIFSKLSWKKVLQPVLFWSVILIELSAVVIINGISRNYYSLTTLAGFNLINHTGKFIESSSAADAEFKTMYLAARDSQYLEQGSQSMTIHRMKYAYMNRRGFSFEEMSKYLLRISADAIIHSPLRYAESIGESMMQFWKPALHYNIVSQSQMGHFIVAIEKRLLIILYAIYLVGTSIFLFSPPAVGKLRYRTVAFIAIIVGYIWIISSLTEYGENYRYKISCEPMIVGLALMYGSLFINSIKKRIHLAT